MCQIKLEYDFPFVDIYVLFSSRLQLFPVHRIMSSPTITTYRGPGAVAGTGTRSQSTKEPNMAQTLDLTPDRSPGCN